MTVEQSGTKPSQPEQDRLDQRMMRRALRIAKRGQPSPNPHVGAIVCQGGFIVSEGYHARAGEAHAEVMAMEQAGPKSEGSTLYVSFEPCNHVGRTGPCTEAILAAGIKRVVVGCRDPAPHVAGSLERLRAAGLEVTVGVCKNDAQRLVEDFCQASYPGATLHHSQSSHHA